MEDCVRLANELAQQVAEELNIPVYLNEEAAKKPTGKTVLIIRQGE
jgi:glutamate formiminotransferase